MSGIIPSVSAGSVSVSVIKKKGTIDLSLSPALKQPSTSGNLQGPRFHGHDQTGSLFLLAGYYRSIPVWKTGLSGIQQPYQYGGFQVLAGYSYDVTALLPNPFLYSPQLTATNSATGQLPFPNSHPVGNQYSGSMVPGALWCNTVFLNSSAIGSYPIANWKISVPNLVLKDTTYTFSAKPYVSYPALGINCNVGGAGYLGQESGPSFVLETPNGLEYFSIFSNTVFPPYWFLSGFQSCGGQSTYDYADMAIQFFPINSGNTYDPNNPGSSYSLPITFNFSDTDIRTVSSTRIPNGNEDTTGWYVSKVNASLGTFIRYYDNYAPISGYPWFGGSVWGNVYNQTNIIRGPIYALTFDDTTDNALLQSSGTSTNPQVGNVPGGGFLIMDSTAFPGILFLVDPTLSTYIKINVSGISSASFEPYSPETLAFDGAGFLNFLQYSTASSFEELLWSGPGKPTIFLASGLDNLPLQWGATICRNPDNCEEAWEA